jgi:hypothetical protein
LVTWSLATTAKGELRLWGLSDGAEEQTKQEQTSSFIGRSSAPSLRGRFVAARNVFADAALRDVEAKFEQFTMDAGCTPKGVLAAHLADEISDFTRNDLQIRCSLVISLNEDFADSRTAEWWQRTCHYIGSSVRFTQGRTVPAWKLKYGYSSDGYGMGEPHHSPSLG